MGSEDAMDRAIVSSFDGPRDPGIARTLHKTLNSPASPCHAREIFSVVGVRKNRDESVSTRGSVVLARFPTSPELRYGAAPLDGSAPGQTNDQGRDERSDSLAWRLLARRSEGLRWAMGRSPRLRSFPLRIGLSYQNRDMTLLRHELLADGVLVLESTGPKSPTPVSVEVQTALERCLTRRRRPCHRCPSDCAAPAPGVFPRLGIHELAQMSEEQTHPCPVARAMAVALGVDTDPTVVACKELPTRRRPSGCDGRLFASGCTETRFKIRPPSTEERTSTWVLDELIAGPGQASNDVSCGRGGRSRKGESACSTSGRILRRRQRRNCSRTRYLALR